ncbi:MAG: hypothetical protein RMM53_08695 [Bacteroidia bacterium]|nr:hypothetical protein [Bacteroidia bacterium]MDW8334277.1 hypothetical protein [Bacteroidia bacterium]
MRTKLILEPAIDRKKYPHFKVKTINALLVTLPVRWAITAVFCEGFLLRKRPQIGWGWIIVMVFLARSVLSQCAKNAAVIPNAFMTHVVLEFWKRGRLVSRVGVDWVIGRLVCVVA